MPDSGDADAPGAARAPRPHGVGLKVAAAVFMLACLVGSALLLVNLLGGRSVDKSGEHGGDVGSGTKVGSARIEELLTEADAKSFEGHRRLLDDDYDAALAAYEETWKLYGRIIEISPGQFHELKRKQVAEWQQDVRRRKDDEEMRKIIEESRKRRAANTPPAPD